MAVSGSKNYSVTRAEIIEGALRRIGEYDQGEAEDNGEILSTEEQVEVPTGHYDDAILTKDTITIQPDVTEYKLYAADVGPVLVLGISGGGGREELIAFGRADAAVAEAAGTTPLGESYLPD